MIQPVILKVACLLRYHKNSFKPCYYQPKYLILASYILNVFKFYYLILELMILDRNGIDIIFL